MARKPENAAVKAVEDRREETRKQNEETERRMNESRPTPTQEENDLAKIGALDIDKKEADGSEPESRDVTSNAPSSGAAAPYSTRASAPSPAKKD